MIRTIQRLAGAGACFCVAIMLLGMVTRVRLCDAELVRHAFVYSLSAFAFTSGLRLVVRSES